MAWTAAMISAGSVRTSHSYYSASINSANMKPAQLLAMATSECGRLINPERRW
jgi:hypothetical protein